jgi:MFS family permease
LIDLILAALFLVAVTHLFLARLNFGVILLFLLPPAGALASRHSPRWSTRLMGSIFIFLISIGDCAALFLPRLGHVFKELSPHESGVLGWYVLIYFGFGLGIFPPVLFIRPLIDHYYHRTTYLSPFTCWLGLLAWLIVGPATVLLVLPLLLKVA